MIYIPLLFLILKARKVTLLHMRDNCITLYYIVACCLCEIKIPATSLFEFELYVTVMYTKRANIVFITQCALRNWNVNIGIYEH